MHYAHCYQIVSVDSLSDFIQTLLPVYFEKHLSVSN